MFQKGSFAMPSDSSGVFSVKIIQTRRCDSRHHAGIGKLRVTALLQRHGIFDGQ